MCTFSPAAMRTRAVGQHFIIIFFLLAVEFNMTNSFDLLCTGRAIDVAVDTALPSFRRLIGQCVFTLGGYSTAFWLGMHPTACVCICMWR